MTKISATKARFEQVSQEHDGIELMEEFCHDVAAGYAVAPHARHARASLHLTIWRLAGGQTCIVSRDFQYPGRRRVCATATIKIRVASTR